MLSGVIGQPFSVIAIRAASKPAHRIGDRGKEILSELETLRDMLRGRIPSQ